MAASFYDVKAVGNYVVLKFISVERELYRKRGEIWVPGEGDSEAFKAVVHHIGPEVSEPVFKVGDEVVFNQYDMKAVGDEDGDKYGIVQGHNIMAILYTK